MKAIDRKDIFVVLICSLLLSPVIFFPMATDGAIFLQAGKIIAEGGKPYVDFIDIKPPLVYYFFSIIYFIFGSGETSVRVFDFLLQVLTVIVLFWTIRQRTYDFTAATAAAIVYAIAYSTLAHNQTMQIESYIPLLSILLLSILTTKQQTIPKLIIAGLLMGIITAFKFTMIFILFVPLLADYLLKTKSFKVMIKQFLWMLSGFLAFICFSLLPFLDSEILSGYENVWLYLSMYSEYPPIDMFFIRETLKTLGTYLGDKFSILLTLAGIIGLVKALGNEEYKQEDKQIKGFFIVAFSIMLLLGLSFILEKKFFPYHISRMYGVGSIFMAIGLTYIIRKLILLFRTQKRMWIVGLSIALFLAVMSPFPRWAALLQPSIAYFTNTEAYNSYYSRAYEGSAVIRDGHLGTVNYIEENSSSKSKVLVISVASSIINYHLGERALNKYMLSSFFISSKRIEPWTQEAKSMLEQAEWLVIQDEDPSLLANRHLLSSREYMLNSHDFGDYIKNNFVLDTVISKFYIYRKINNANQSIN